MRTELIETTIYYNIIIKITISLYPRAYYQLKIETPLNEMQQPVFYSSLVIILSCLTLGATLDARAAKREPIVLDEDSWTRLMDGEWMVDFYAPWCPACKKLEPEWKKFAEWSDDLNINIASADVTINPGLSGRFMVSGLPTIYHVKDGVFRLYSGPRDHTAFINFVEEQGWKAVEPISRWWSPDTFQMSLVAYSFRISMKLRDVHNYLVDDIGLPYYISYLIFALGTVGLGTILGLLIVFVIDQFIPSRYAGAMSDHDLKPNSEKRKKTDKESDSDLDDAAVDDSRPSSQQTEKVRRRVNNSVKVNKIN